MIETARRHATWFLLAGALIVVGVVQALRASGPPPPPLAASSARPDGGLALVLWLQRTGSSVSVSHDPPDLSTADTPRTLALLTSGSDIPSGDGKRLRRWLARGNRLVVVADGATGERALAALGVSVVPAGGGDMRIVQPVLLRPPVSRVEASCGMALSARGSVTVARTPDGACLLRLPVGGGTTWLLGTSDPLQNSNLSHSQNLALARNLFGDRRGRLLVSEYRPPVASQTGDWMTGTPWGIGLTFLLAIVILYRFLTGIRLGPPILLPHERPRSTAEYVYSMAGLLRRAGARQGALEVYRRRLRRRIEQRYGGVEALDLDTRLLADRVLDAAPPQTDDDLMARARDAVQCEQCLARGA